MIKPWNTLRSVVGGRRETRFRCTHKNAKSYANMEATPLYFSRSSEVVNKDSHLIRPNEENENARIIRCIDTLNNAIKDLQGAIHDLECPVHGSKIEAEIRTPATDL